MSRLLDLFEICSVFIFILNLGHQLKLREWVNPCRLITVVTVNCSWVSWNKLKETCSFFFFLPLLAADTLNPPFRTPGGPRTPAWGSLLPPSVQTHRALGPASFSDAVMHGLMVTWCSWSGDPRGSQWGLQGGDEEKAEAEVLFEKEGRRHRRNHYLAIISKLQLVDFSSSAFTSNLRLICFYA